LQEALAQFQEVLATMARLSFSGEQQEYLQQLEQRAQAYAMRPTDMDAVARSDRESELEEWLDERDVEDAWELAPVLGDLVLGPEELAQLEKHFEGEELRVVVKWLGATFSVHSLLIEIGHGATRISEVVRALKAYSYLDQAPVQDVNLHEGLDNALIMLRGQLKGVTVRRKYAPDLPRITAYGSELNQVWTNLLDNAADALGGRGTIEIRTRQEGEWVVVEIEDDGPGIPVEIQPQLFDAFFTTKPPGQGTGLGLNISYNIVVHKHRGNITVYSQPGKTCFQVILPVNFDDAGGPPPVAIITRPTDAQLRQILDSTRTIAVVGMSERPDAPAHSVPAYLQERGYQIIPVHPTATAIRGEKAYPRLTLIPEPVDLVLLFRPSDLVAPHVEEAIRIGARVVWMQEGIINEQAAEIARRAGLQVVMDTCMRAAHRRLC
jgi:signal transduction histidine kinase/predicted CoA-binding protein